MKHLYLGVVFATFFSVSSFAQTLSVDQLIRAWKAGDTSQTTLAEATYADLKAHITGQAFTSRIAALNRYLDEHPSTRLKVRILMYRILGKDELNIPLDVSDTRQMRRAITLTGLMGDKQLLSELYTLYGERSELASKLFYDLKAIQIQNEIGYRHFPMLWLRYLNVSGALFSLQEFKESIVFGKRGLELMQSCNSSLQDHILQLDYIGSSFWKSGDPDSTIYYYREINRLLSGHSFADSNYKKIWAGIVQGGYGMAFYLQKKYDEAIPLLRENVASSDTFHQLDDAAKAINVLGQIHFEKQKYDSALSEWRQGWRWAMTHDDLAKEAFAVKGIRNVYKALGKYDSAYKYNELFHAYRDTMIENISNNRLAAVNTRIEYGNMQGELINEKAYIRHQLHIRNIILAGIVVITILLILFFYSYDSRQRSRQEKLEHERQLAQVEVENAKRQMADFSRNISEKVEMIEALQSKINGEAADPILPDLRHFTILTEEDWQDFKYNFEKVYPDYWNRLDEKFPHLTIAEKRFMALSKLGLNNKEMAAASGVSPQTIRVLTHRLRKKLNISETTDLKVIAYNI